MKYSKNGHNFANTSLCGLDQKMFCFFFMNVSFFHAIMYSIIYSFIRESHTHLLMLSQFNHSSIHSWISAPMLLFLSWPILIPSSYSRSLLPHSPFPHPLPHPPLPSPHPIIVDVSTASDTYPRFNSLSTS